MCLDNKSQNSQSINDKIELENEYEVDEMEIIEKKIFNSKIIIIIIIIGLILGVIFIFIKSYYNYKNKDEIFLYNSINEIVSLEREIETNAKIDDLRRINILQSQYYENIKINEIENHILIDRKTVYCHFIVCEEDESIQNNNLYNNTCQSFIC